MRILDFENGRVSMTKVLNWNEQTVYLTTYGLEVKQTQDLGVALINFNNAVRHALACDGLMEEEG